MHLWNLGKHENQGNYSVFYSLVASTKKYIFQVTQTQNKCRKAWSKLWTMGKAGSESMISLAPSVRIYEQGNYIHKIKCISSLPARLKQLPMGIPYNSWSLLSQKWRRLLFVLHCHSTLRRKPPLDGPSQHDLAVPEEPVLLTKEIGLHGSCSLSKGSGWAAGDSPISDSGLILGNWTSWSLLISLSFTCVTHMWGRMEPIALWLRTVF